MFKKYMTLFIIAMIGALTLLSTACLGGDDDDIDPDDLSKTELAVFLFCEDGDCDENDWDFDSDTDTWTYEGDEITLVVPDNYVASAKDNCYTAGDSTRVEEAMVAEGDDEEDCPGTAVVEDDTSDDETSRPTDPNGPNFPPILHHDDTCPPEDSAEGGCSFDVGVHGDQIGLGFGVTVDWPEGGIPDQNGRCDLVILTPGWYENLHLMDGRFEVYTIGSDRTGWIENLATQRADEQTGDYKCPQKSYSDIPVWTSDTNSPPDNVNWQASDAQPNTSSDVQPQGNTDQTQGQNTGSTCNDDPATVNGCARRGEGTFNAGEAVYGYEITLASGDSRTDCFMQSAPTAGTVNDGVINPWKDEVANARAC